MKYSEVLNRYVNTGSQIPEKQYKQLSQSLQKSYIRMRGVVGYFGWEFKYLTDDEKIKYIEKKGDELDYNDVEYLLYYSENTDIIATKIIETKGEELDYKYTNKLFKYSKDKYLIATKIIETLNEIDDNVISILVSDFHESDIKDNIIKKIIENNEKMEYMNSDKIIFFLRHSQNENNIAIKIIKTIDKSYFTVYNMKYLFIITENKELIKKLLLQNGVDYKLINRTIRDYNFEKDGVSYIEPIPDNYQEMLHEIRRIKEIMR